MKITELKAQLKELQDKIKKLIQDYKYKKRIQQCCKSRQWFNF